MATVELRSGSDVTHAALKTSGLWAGYHRAQRRMEQAPKREHDGVPVDGRAMGRRRSRGAEVEQRLIPEETWYVRKCRDGSVLSYPSVIVHPLPAGMARLQSRAYRARLWRRDAGGGSPLSPVSGAAPERQAQAMSCAVCTVLCPRTNWGLSLLMPQVVCAGLMALSTS